MTINENILQILEYTPCCNLATVPVAGLHERERGFFTSFMPKVVTAIALAHHIVTEEEWTWYSPGNSLERCAADDHLRDVCLKIKKELENQRYETEIVKYPLESGLQFRFVAETAGLGKIGNNAFLFHPEWGPWVHLRIMGTTANLDLQPEVSGDQFCDECGLCISECPAQAISDDTFRGLQCRSYRKARGEYDPQGASGLLPYCKRCILICPKGEQPVPHQIE